MERFNGGTYTAGGKNVKTTTSQNGTTQLEHHGPLQSAASQRVKRLQRRQIAIIVGGRILVFLLVIAAWQIASLFIDPLFDSSPLADLQQLATWTTDGTLWFNAQITLEETLLGLLFGVTAGILAGFVLGLRPMLGDILDPFVVALYSVPKVALAPLFFLWFGFGLEMKVIIAAVTVFFLVFFNTLAGVRDVDQNLIDAVRLMGGKRRDITFKVIVPSATGYVLAGLHMAVPYALIGAVIGEVISENRGLGYLIDDSANLFNPAGVFAALIVLTVIAVLLNLIVHFIDRKTSRWKAGMRTTGKIIPQ
jgi:NitT/TauT family transport system permease protein